MGGRGKRKWELLNLKDNKMQRADRTSFASNFQRRRWLCILIVALGSLFPGSQLSGEEAGGGKSAPTPAVAPDPKGTEVPSAPPEFGPPAVFRSADLY